MWDSTVHVHVLLISRCFHKSFLHHTFIHRYINGVKPGEYGVPKPFYFPCLPSYWSGAPRRSKTVKVKYLNFTIIYYAWIRTPSITVVIGANFHASGQNAIRYDDYI